MGWREILSDCEGFEWDTGNAPKLWERHQVTPSECEELFFNLPLVVAGDDKHSIRERRYYALGQSDSGRLLFVVFTLRARLIRIISARNMSRKEREVYQSS